MILKIKNNIKDKKIRFMLLFLVLNNLCLILYAKDNSNRFNQIHYIHGVNFKPELIVPVSGKPIKKYGVLDFENGSSFYPAIDYKFNKETAIYSAAKGNVIISGKYKNGNIIVIKSNYYYTIYRGISDVYVKKGSFIRANKMIGKSIGKFSFEVRDLNGNAYNPENYFSFNKSIYSKNNIVKSALYNSFISFMELHGFRKNDIQMMYCIASWESSFNPIAINRNENGTQDTGLFQINDVWLKRCKMKRSDLFNVKNNANCARIVLEEQGFKAWVTYNKFRNQC